MREFDWENAVLDVDPSIGVMRQADGSETRHWEYRRTSAFGGNVAVKQLGKVIPYIEMEITKDMESAPPKAS